MRIEVKYKQYDRMIYLSDWRYSAAVVGMIKYFKSCDIEYEVDDDNFEYGPCLYYRSEDITEKRYLDFVEEYYKDKMHHCYIENLLAKEDIGEDEIKSVNDYLGKTTTLKSLFKANDISFDGTNKEEILNILASNRAQIIKSTFANGKKLYAKFIAPGLLFSEDQPYCRLHGYWIDKGRKRKSIEYRFAIGSCVFQDIKEFDFIPFAFSKTNDGFFVNNNCTIQALEEANNKLARSLMDNNGNYQYGSLLRLMSKGVDYLESNIEIIKIASEKIKIASEKEYFETIYIRPQAIHIMRKSQGSIDHLESLHIINKSDSIDIAKETFEHAINLTSVDELIDILLKDHKRAKTIEKLIDINVLINSMQKENSMNKKDTSIIDAEIENKRNTIKRAKACAFEIVNKLRRENKINKLETYRAKLTSAVVAHDYDRVCEILLQLSTYTGTSMFFAYDLFEDFESNKNIIYSFISALDKNYNSDSKKSETTLTSTKE